MRSSRSADAARCARRIAALYGDDLASPAGVVHVVAAWQPPVASGRDAAPLSVLRTGASMPASRTDPFVLRVARARCDTILTTGRNLRSERGLTHTLVSTRADTRDVGAWRHEVVGKPEPPHTAVLTRGESVDFDHPVLRGANRRYVLTTEDAAKRLRSPAAAAGVDVVGIDRLSIRTAIGWLRDECGQSSICVEAGPSTASQLYDDPVAVDELMLSLFLADALDERSAGPDFLPMSAIAAALPAVLTSTTIAEPSGSWQYSRRARSRA